ncbi:MAG: hypothetical protein KDA28_11215, partial [Phycisphaerales bacterium]|nr:hypothetical protein [Phycisphaerales bacterium]
RPPGVRLGPLLADWTMESWVLGQESLQAAPAFACSGLLSRRLDGRWELVLQAQGRLSIDRIRVFIGPTGHERAIFEVTTGGVIDRVSGTPVVAEIETTDIGWLTRLPIPESLARGEILMGIERDVGTGHSAWPRRMFPWSDAPGRWRLDLESWDAIDAPE